MLLVIELVAAGGVWWLAVRHPASANPPSTVAADPNELDRSSTPAPDGNAGNADDRNATKPAGTGADAIAAAKLATMSPEERAAQTMMVPLQNTDDPSALRSLIADQHVGSVVLLGQWTTGTAGVKAATDQLRALAGADNPLLVGVDQEGGLVQHLKGTGFDEMPSGVEQGALDAATLRAQAKAWGGQLAQAGVNVDLAPVTDTVTVADRATNAPIGALDRDFGLDAAGNATHATAYVQGLGDAKVMGTLKHFPGLGGVTGNTDFTAEGIVDSTTTADGAEVAAFRQAIADSSPAMVMMSLATYTQLDASSPAAFSSTVVDGLLRGQLGYDGVVISDSLSAAAVSNVSTDQLGVRFIQAGGDLICVGDPSMSQTILDGIVATMRSDSQFAKRVDQAATRVLTLKAKEGLLS